MPVKGDGLQALLLDVELQVILQVFADAGQLVEGADAGLRKARARTDAGKQQQLR